MEELFQISTTDPYSALEALSRLFLVNKQPSVVFYNNESSMELLENFLVHYDVTVKNPPAFSKTEKIVLYNRQSLPLALFSFPFFARKALFLERQRVPSISDKCDYILLGNTELEQKEEGVTVLKSPLEVLAFVLGSDFSTLVLVNSADFEIEDKGKFREDTNRYWASGLSILGTYIAATRRGVIYDVASAAPDFREIEREINSNPIYHNIRDIMVVGSPGALPFIFDGASEFVLGDSYKTDVIRDYVIWKGNYFKTNQGRILGENILDASLLFQRSRLKERQRHIKLKGMVCSDSKTCLEDMSVAAPVPMLRASAQFVSEELRKQGYEMLEFFEKANSLSNLQKHLPESMFCFIANHGILMYLRTSEKSFGSKDVPSQLPPIQIYLLSCLTTRLKGLWFSSNGLNWNYDSIAVEDSLPLMAIKNGASLFVGLTNFGLEVEANVMFMDVFRSLLMQGEKVGDAVKEARNDLVAINETELFGVAKEDIHNYELLHSYLNMSNSEFQIYGDHESFLLHDENLKSYDLIKITESGKNRTVEISIPEDVWQEKNDPLTGKAQNSYNTEAIRTLYPATPYSILMRSIPLDRNQESGIAKLDINYYAFLVKLALPPGKTVSRVILEEATPLDITGYDGQKQPLTSIDDPRKLFGTMKVKGSPYVPLKEVVLVDNFPFALESDDAPSVVRILVPTVAVDADKRLIARLKKARLKVEYTEGIVCRGRVISEDNLPIRAYLTFKHTDGWFRKIRVDENGKYVISIPKGQYKVTIDAPLHSSIQKDLVLNKESFIHDFTLSPNEKKNFSCQVLDEKTGTPVASAKLSISILVGPSDPKNFEDYKKGKEQYPHVFVSDGLTDNEGRYEKNLPAGLYVIGITKENKENKEAALYLPQEERADLHENVKASYKIKPAGTLKGKVIDSQTELRIPDSAVIVAFPPAEKKEDKDKNQDKQKKEEKKEPKLARYHTDLKGDFYFPLLAGQPLKAMGVFEGYTNTPVEFELKQGEVKEIELLCHKIKALQ